MRLKIFKIILLTLMIFIGVGAFYGGIAFLIKPDGSLLQMESVLSYFQVLPFADVLFQDYVFSGIMLIIVNGISNITASIFVLKNKRIGYVLGTIFGFTLILWIIIQFIIFPFFIIDLVYLIFGILQLICGYIALVSFNQENFKFNEKDYSINKDSDTLVVYFSRMGYTKKIAYETANSLKANIQEITTKERTQGNAGFWWCGRFALHGWEMNINETNLNLSDYKKVVIVSPIWVFRMCAPIRCFIKTYKNELNTKNVDIIFNHFNPWLPSIAKKEVKRIIDVKAFKSKTTILGHTFK